MAVTYTTNDEVRKESGFQYNQNITDAEIELKRLAAFSIINSMLGSRYKLPFLTNPLFANSAAEMLLNSIELNYAAGLMLIVEYGNEGIDTDKDGYRRKTDAEKMLNSIVAGDILLLGSDGKQLSTNQDIGQEATVKLTASSYPQNGQNKRAFSTKQVF